MSKNDTKGFACPVCGAGFDRLTVQDTRPHPYGVWRRRKCLNCGFRVMTRETADGQEEKPKQDWQRGAPVGTLTLGGVKYTVVRMQTGAQADPTPDEIAERAKVIREGKL